MTARTPRTMTAKREQWIRALGPRKRAAGDGMKTYYKVSFDFEDDSWNANSQDFRDLLMEMFQQAVLEGRMTDVMVGLDHARMAAERLEGTEQQIERQRERS